jgi:hypothetical protein
MDATLTVGRSMKSSAWACAESSESTSRAPARRRQYSIEERGAFLAGCSRA